MCEHFGMAIDHSTHMVITDAHPQRSSSFIPDTLKVSGIELSIIFSDIVLICQ